MNVVYLEIKKLGLTGTLKCYPSKSLDHAWPTEQQHVTCSRPCAYLRGTLRKSYGESTFGKLDIKPVLITVTLQKLSSFNCVLSPSPDASDQADAVMRVPVLRSCLLAGRNWPQYGNLA